MSTRLRALVGDGKTHVLVGVYNAITAKIAESAGFEMVGVSGYGVSASLIGQPDVGLTTMTEIVTVSGYVADAVAIPVIADADTGFGNAINTMRTVEQFIKAGVAGIHIEDQVAPKRCGHVAGKEIIPIEEAVGKYRAAVRARDGLDKDFVLIARTDARGVAGGSVEETIRRSKAYLDAGVDVVFPEGLVSPAELERVCREVKAPILYNRTGVSPQLSLTELQEMGVSLVANANGALRAACRAMYDYLRAFKAEDAVLERRLKEELKNHPVGDFHAFVGFPAIRKLEEEFLPREEILRKYEGSIGFKP
jgi:2-methylisocitrate lyase-like PEP mutase family enzyme